MPDQSVPCVYYEASGPGNTARTLQIAYERAVQLGINHIIVASSTGKTGVAAAQLMRDVNLVVVSHSSGFAAPNQQELLPEYAEAIRAQGAHLLTSMHALGGIGRAVRRKLGAYQVEEIIAFALRSFCQGMKVVCEITAMAADAGLVPVGEEVAAVAGTSSGADTAAVLLAANAQDFFDLRVLEVLCKPRRAR